MLSCIILTRNEERNIERCLKSISFCDEIVIVDDNSTDKTVSLAKKYRAMIVNHTSNGDFASQRNFAMEKVQGDWILFVDADEEVTSALREDIRCCISDTRNKSKIADIDGFYLKRRDFFWHKEMKYGETSKARNHGILRLVKKGVGTWKGNVHEEFVHKQETVNGKRLNGYINHYPHQNIKEFIQSINEYSTLRAKELLNQGKKAYMLQIIFYPFGKFILTYFVKRGFLDGPEGFVYSFMMSFHSFLVRAKLYQYQNLN